MENLTVTPNNPEFFAEIDETAADRVEISCGKVVADSSEALEIKSVPPMPDAQPWYWGDEKLSQRMF